MCYSTTTQKNLNTRLSLLATILSRARVENGIIFLLMSLFIKNTATEKSQVSTTNACSPEDTYKIVSNCEYQVDWMITIADIISSAFFYVCPIFNLLFLFRPYQLKGVKRKLLLVSFVLYVLDALYHGVLQAVGKPFCFNFLLYTGLCLIFQFIFSFSLLSVHSSILSQHTCLYDQGQS